MDKYSTYALEKRIDDIFCNVINSGFIWKKMDNMDCTFLFVMNDMNIEVYNNKDTIVYHVPFTGKTKVLLFVLIFDKYTSRVSLYQQMEDKKVLFTDDFINDAIFYVIAETVNICNKINTCNTHVN